MHELALERYRALMAAGLDADRARRTLNRCGACGGTGQWTKK